MRTTGLCVALLVSPVWAQGIATQEGGAGSGIESGEHESDSDQVVGFSNMGAHIRRLDRDERIAAAGYCGCDDNPQTSGCVLVLTKKECGQLLGPRQRSDRTAELYAESFPIVLRRILRQRALLDPLASEQPSDSTADPAAAQGMHDSNVAPE